MYLPEPGWKLANYMHMAPYLDSPYEEAISKSSHIQEQYETKKMLNEVR